MAERSAVCLQQVSEPGWKKCCLSTTGKWARLKEVLSVYSR